MASDLRLEPPGRALVVSGPNGGGKTVAITAVGLSALMLQRGAPHRRPGAAPACPSTRRSAPRWRSTATWPATSPPSPPTSPRCATSPPGPAPASLVLVDEIAADTDPREGAALASAILEDLLDRGATVLVTTHLDELKALALSDARFANARVGFDPERLAPTFQLHLGSPGSSSAIEVARRVGLPESVLATGAGLPLRAGRGARRGPARALRGAGAPGGPAGRARAGGRRRRAGGEEAARRGGGRLPRREGGGRPGGRVAGRGGRGRARRGPPGPRRAPVRPHREEGQRGRPGSSRSGPGSLEKASRVAVLAGGRRSRGRARRRGRAGRPRPRRLARTGGRGARDLRATRRSSGSAALRVRRPVADLLPLRGKAKGRRTWRARGTTGSARPRRRARRRSPAGSRRLDVRGMRVDDLLREVDAFLDRLFAEGAMDAVILHGHGTGALKEALRDSPEGVTLCGCLSTGGSTRGWRCSYRVRLSTLT